jgi:hypothetical protein
MGLYTYEVDVFLKNSFHVSMSFFPLLPLLVVVVVLFLLVRIYEHSGSDHDRGGHSIQE